MSNDCVTPPFAPALLLIGTRRTAGLVSGYGALMHIVCMQARCLRQGDRGELAGLAKN